MTMCEDKIRKQLSSDVFLFVIHKPTTLCGQQRLRRYGQLQMWLGGFSPLVFVGWYSFCSEQPSRLMPLSRRLPTSVTLLRCGRTFPSQPLCASPNSEVSPPGSGWTAFVLPRLQTGVCLRGCLWSPTQLCCGWSVGCVGNEELPRCRVPAAAVGVPVTRWWGAQRWCCWSWCLDQCAGGGMPRGCSGAHSPDQVAGCKSEACQEWRKEKGGWLQTTIWGCAVNGGFVFAAS